jgi:hypothetical protein
LTSYDRGHNIAFDKKILQIQLNMQTKNNSLQGNRHKTRAKRELCVRVGIGHWLSVIVPPQHCGQHN